MGKTVKIGTTILIASAKGQKEVKKAGISCLLFHFRCFSWIDTRVGNQIMGRHACLVRMSCGSQVIYCLDAYRGVWLPVMLSVSELPTLPVDGSTP